MAKIRPPKRKHRRTALKASSSEKLQWMCLWKGLRAGRRGFSRLPIKVQNKNISDIAKLGLSAANIARVLRTTRGLVLARARDFPKTVRLRGDTEANLLMNCYLRTLR